MSNTVQLELDVNSVEATTKSLKLNNNNIIIRYINAKKIIY